MRLVPRSPVNCGSYCLVRGCGWTNELNGERAICDGNGLVGEEDNSSCEQAGQVAHRAGRMELFVVIFRRSGEAPIAPAT